MTELASRFSLKGKRGLVAGVANEHSIAYGCAKSFHALGAELMLTYGHPKAEPHVQALLESIGNPPMMFCDVQNDAQVNAVFERIETEWGKLDFLVHCIAFAPQEDLHGRVVDCSRAGFRTAMDISCYSFIHMARLAEPLMTDGGCLLTMSYYGAEKVVEHYNIMGPVKAALEGTVRYMAAELGPQGIRVHALSPGPLKTRAATGIQHFDALLDDAARETPVRHLVTIDDVGAVAACLVTDAASSLTGHIAYVDAGQHIIA